MAKKTTTKKTDKPETLVVENLTVYGYNPETLEYVGKETAYPDPMQPGEHLIPANATTVAPSPCDPNRGQMFWDSEKWVFRPHPEIIITPEQKGMLARRKRDQLMRESDYTQMVDVAGKMKKSDVDKWTKYRQDLRDIPAQKGFPESINWPEKP